MRTKTRHLLLAVLLTTAFAAAAPAASAATFKTSISGTQELTWKLDGTEGSCDIRRGAGGGTVSFKFASPRSEPVFVDRSGRSLKIVGSLNAAAKGSINGAFQIQTVAACPGFTPDYPEPLVSPATGCGATAYKLRADFWTRGAFTYLTGVKTTGAFATGECPFPTDLSILQTTDFTTCGDGANQWQRSFGVTNSRGEGLFGSRMAISVKRLMRLKRGKSKTITGRKQVSCNMPSQYSGGVSYEGDLRYSIKFKRTS